MGLQRVWSCTCGWRGASENTVPGEPWRQGDPPPHCRRCASTALTQTSETHPRVTRVCQRVECRGDYIGHLGSKYCPACMPLMRKKRAKKYDWTPALDQWLREHYKSGVKGLPGELARQRGWPKWVITHRAQILGICRTKEPPWSDAEVEFVERWAALRSAYWIQRQPVMRRRSVTAIVVKMKRLDISRRDHPGYLSMHQLEKAIGVDHRVIASWVRSGVLKADRKQSDRVNPHGGDQWVFADGDVLRFILRHPTNVRLAAIEQTWLFDVMRRALREVQSDIVLPTSRPA